MMLNRFSDPATLVAIGPNRVALFLENFPDESKARNLVLPAPESHDPGILENLAFALAKHAIRDRLHNTMVAIETVALPENEGFLTEVIRRRFPCVSFDSFCALNQALEIWFSAREELGLFAINNASTLSFGPEVGLVTQCEPCPISATSYPTLAVLLHNLTSEFRRLVILPKYAAETLALFTVHTYAFQLRDVSVYLGIESPEKGCGKTTLLTVLDLLVHNPVVASNISPSAFFRVIEEMQPTLLIDEADTFLHGNDDLRGILNAGYRRKTAFVIRVSNLPRPKPTKDEPVESPSQSAISHLPSPGSSLTRFSCWCPKAIATIGHLPETLADRCITIRIQKKTADEQCDRIKSLDPTEIIAACQSLVESHAQQIADAKPVMPAALSDRAADIWEPLIALADIAGGDWPQFAREAALVLSSNSQEQSPLGSLLATMLAIFSLKNDDRMFSRDLIAFLNQLPHSPWRELTKGKDATELWLSRVLRPYGLRPTNLRLNGDQAKGYFKAELVDLLRRYMPQLPLDAFLAPPQDLPNGDPGPAAGDQAPSPRPSSGVL